MTPEMQALLAKLSEPITTQEQPGEHGHFHDENCGCSKAIPDSLREQWARGRALLRQQEDSGE